jgi:hypothetical protein
MGSSQKCRYCDRKSWEHRKQDYRYVFECHVENLGGGPQKLDNVLSYESA